MTDLYVEELRDEVVEELVQGPQGPVGPAGPQGPPGDGSGALPDINPAVVTANILGGTVNRKGLVESPAPATNVASATVQLQILNAVTDLATDVAGLKIGGVTAPLLDPEDGD